jgi:toxin ParE1/3/4
MKVRFADVVGADLRALVRFHQDLLDPIIDQCYFLADFPRRYPLVPRYERFGLRRCPYRGYLIFYRVQEAIDIVRILHGATDYEPLLFPED